MQALAIGDWNRSDTVPTMLAGMHVNRSPPCFELIWEQRSVQLVSTIRSYCYLEGVGIERAGERNGREVRSGKFHIHGEQELSPLRR